ncbi:aminoglycoside phosphotransferase [Streptomyces sp. NBC_00659]|uniref:aminoglycoside phosphotransferase n=1 Tax=Streptomyces sp. NBC_00659 TaxID=2903669 RepID=UPI002E34AE8E|nr:aminoglycoside phosphotransferase [Streptomyces sp. NBC_00659]
MPTPRMTELPDAALSLIEKASGRITDVGTVRTGLNSSIAVCVRTSTRTLFVKGLPLDHPRVWTQKREAEISPYVRSIAPELRWLVEADGWSLLGFQYVEGGHADYTPASSDLPAVSAAMAQLAELRAPGLDLKTMTHRYRTYVDDPADLTWFEGDSLLHTEWNPHNVLITDAGALLVDWGWASTGAAWIDPALWLLWLIAHGHTAEQAESVTAAHPAWKLAPPAGLDTLALVQQRLWDSIAEQSPDEWAQPMQDAARVWNMHRQHQR